MSPFILSKSNYDSETSFLFSPLLTGEHLASETNIQKQLSDIWSSEQRHAVITGSGGAGKSSLLKWLFCQLAEQKDADSPIPMYVSLSAYEGENYIVRQILKNFCGNTATKDDIVVRDTLWKLFSNSVHTKPEFFLLLDGINEVSEDTTFNLYRELISIAEEWTAVQIVITSRHELDRFKRLSTQLEALPLSKETVGAFLSTKRGYDSKNISHDLREILNTPMYLTMYVGLCLDVTVDTEKLQSTKTVGDLFELHIERLIAMTDEYGHADKESLAYILHLFFPRMAWTLNSVAFTYTQIKKAILEAYHYTLNLDFPVPFTVTENTENDFIRIAIRTLVSRGLIIESDQNTFRFQHQNFLEYFASKFIYNEMTYRDVLPECMCTRLDEVYISWLSDLFHEHYFPNDSHDPSPIETWMQKHCAHKDATLPTALAISNCIEILKHARENCLSVNFSGLDLSQARFFRTDLRGSSFYNANVINYSFEPVNVGCDAVDRNVITSADSSVIASNYASFLHILFAGHYVPFVFYDYHPSKIIISNDSTICTFIDGGSVYLVDLVKLASCGPEDVICPIYTSALSDSPLSAYKLSDDRRILATAHERSLVISQMDSGAEVRYHTDSPVECVFVCSTVSGAEVLFATHKNIVYYARTDFKTDTLTISKQFKLIQQPNKGFVYSIRKNNDFVLIESFVPFAQKCVLHIICLSQDLVSLISSEVVYNSVSYYGSTIRYQTKLFGDVWYFDTSKWIQWVLTGNRLDFDGKKWTFPHLSYVAVQGQTFSNNQCETAYNSPLRQKKIHTDLAVNIINARVSPSGRYAACVLRLATSHMLIRVYDLESMTTRVFKPNDSILPYTLSIYDNDILRINLDDGRSRDKVYIINLRTHTSEYSKERNTDYSLQSNQTQISDFLLLAPWTPARLESCSIFDYLSDFETLSLSRITHKKDTRWRTKAAMDYLGRLEDKLHIPSKIVSYSANSVLILFVYINMLICFDRDKHRFSVLDISDDYITSDYNVAMSPDGKYTAITFESSIRILHTSTHEIIWTYLRNVIDRYRTLPIGFSEDSLRFYLGKKKPDGSLSPNRIVYTESGFECAIGCSAASNELAVLVHDGISDRNAYFPNATAIFFNYVTGKILYHWHNWYVNMDGCDFRGALLENEMRDRIQANGGITD